jgi:putative protease
MAEMPFFQISMINELRREATDRLMELRVNNYTRESSVIEKNGVPYPQKKLDYRFNISNHLAEKFYQRHGAEIFEKAYELNSDVHDEVVMETKHCIRYQLDACLLTSTSHALPEPLYLNDQHTRYRLRFKCKECVMQIVKESQYPIFS